VKPYLCACACVWERERCVNRKKWRHKKTTGAYRWNSSESFDHWDGRVPVKILTLTLLTKRRIEGKRRKDWLQGRSYTRRRLLIADHSGGRVPESWFSNKDLKSHFDFRERKGQLWGKEISQCDEVWKSGPRGGQRPWNLVFEEGAATCLIIIKIPRKRRQEKVWLTGIASKVARTIRQGESPTGDW